tara:strand:- start:64 stop:540 length:477 start_codon:yes stop_codon:yes gene_type:complete
LTKQEFRDIYKTISYNYQNIEVNPFTPKLHYRYFKEVPVEKFKAAIVKTIAESEFYPSVATINKYLKEVSGIPALEEIYEHIYNIMGICHKGSWSPKDYPEIVVRIIEECGHITGIMQLSNDEFLSKIKTKYYDIVEIIKKEQDNKTQLSPGKPVTVR